VTALVVARGLERAYEVRRGLFKPTFAAVRLCEHN
jgi:hypothetical protein